jgi:hypothetical protein
MRKTFRTMLFSTLALLLAAGASPIYLVQAAALPVSPGNAGADMINPTPVSPLPASTDQSMVPGTPSGKEQVIYDQVDTSTAKQKQSYGGEQYSVGKFERPFDQQMNYLPYLDIVKSTLQRADPNFIYATIQVASPISTSEAKPAQYGLELDTNLDGRSEYLVLADKPLSTEWTVTGVNVWKSTSAETAVSGAGSSIPVTGSMGFDQNLFAAGKGTDTGLAWVRLSPTKADTVEIAFKNTLIGGEKGKFIWYPITDGAAFSSKSYDLNVNYTLEQAGSPLKENANYPLKDVYAVDNTCRVASGYIASGKEIGLCPLPPPPAKADKPGPSVPNNPNTQPDNPA